MQGTVTLEAVSGPMRGQVFRFVFILEVNPPAARIRDLGSLNGTYVNGAKYLGATLYALLTGVGPRDFPAGKDPIQVILQAPTVPIRERDAVIPAALARVIERALAVDSADRYQTAAEFREALGAV